MKRRTHFLVLLLLVSIMATGLPWVRGQSSNTQKPNTQKPNVPKKKETVESPIMYAGARYDSGNRRDPFFNLLQLRKRKDNLNENEEEAPGLPPPGIAGMSIAQVSLLGISVREGNHTAIFQGSDKRAYFLQEGDRLFDGFLKQIESDSVLMVRQTKLKSGKVLAQDVTKRLRTP